MNEELRIEIKILHRPYSIKIKRGDSRSEETLRKAGQMVNNSVQQFQKLNLENKDDQDYLAMAGLNIAVRALDTKQENNTDSLIKELRDISLMLDSYLAEA